MSQNGLEDQIRNMILTGSSPQPAPSVRLPPPSGAFVQQNQAPPYNAYPPPQQAQHGRGYGYGQNRGQSFQPGQHQGYQNRGRGRGFAQFNQGQQQHPQHPQHLQQAQQYQQVDPNAFMRGGRGGRGGSTNYGPPSQQRRQLYQPASQPQNPYAQSQYLDGIAAREIPIVEMSQTERDEKESFRKELEKICQEVCASDPGRLPEVSIEGFGSFESGFASAGSDMDLVLVVKDSSPTAECFSPMENDLPRALEKRLLQMGIGAHLLTRTRVPIIKVCQNPGSSLLDKLREEREKWEGLDRDKKYPHLKEDNDEAGEGGDVDTSQTIITDKETNTSILIEHTPSISTEKPTAIVKDGSSGDAPAGTSATPATPTTTEAGPQTDATKQGEVAQKSRREPWTRERKAGPLDFPKDGVGIQTDINFFNPLGIHNTQMLCCYSLCDPRVRPMILFVKSWAKRRKINSSYSGTLSSYGFVLMVLHYLVNIANPPVLPNLQLPWRPHDRCTPQGVDKTEIEGWEVDFWRREDEIKEAAQRGVLSRNKEPLGALLAGFFQYYSSQGGYPSFHWMGQVLSLRTQGGLLSKEAKGWVKAVTEHGVGKQVQHRYLFCIEDPFEQSHNVARTVTHNGIVAIRDEFRRAQRILRAVGEGFAVPRDGGLFDELTEEEIATETPPRNWNGGKSQQSGQQPGQQPGQQTGQPGQQPGQQPQTQSRPQQCSQRQGHAAVQPRSLNVKNTEDFPSLGGPKTK
jgi:terminal uridylyltransferase